MKIHVSSRYIFYTEEESSFINNNYKLNEKKKEKRKLSRQKKDVLHIVYLLFRCSS